VPLLARLAVVLSLLTSISLTSWLHLAEREAWPVPILGICLLLLLFVLDYTFSYFNSVISLAVNGSTKSKHNVDSEPSLTLHNVLKWLGCFLAGPGVLLCGAVAYWISIGELTAIDWLVLTELILAALAWWLISLVLSNSGQNIRVPSPQKVLSTAYSLGSTAIKQTMLIAGGFLVHIIADLFAISQLHENPLSGFLLLCLCWTSGLNFGVFAFRRLGLAFKQMQQLPPKDGRGNDAIYESVVPKARLLPSINIS